MKKLLFAICIMCFAYAASAQTTLTNSADTITNSTTVYATSAKQNTAFDRVSIQPVYTKLSGTVSAYALVQGSIDGTNYVDINTDTLALANQTTNTKIWVLEKTPYLYYRVKCVSSGTMSIKQSAKLLGRNTPR
jgi:hypothetical protein